MGALTHAGLARACTLLARADPDLARLHKLHGPPPLWARRPGFEALVRIILEQQVSLDAARTMFGRLAERLDGITPQTVASAGVEGLRALGLTRQKAAYCHGLAERLRSGALDLRAVSRAPEAEGRALLLAVPGLGPWSVGLYFIMALRRPDVWPQGDLALAIALAQVKRLRSRPDAARQLQLAKRWAPWRAVAARMLWQHYLAQRGRL
ncbi:MAG TPA: hypothetical protein VIS77_11690 [Burkholderiales bacterium]